MLEAIRCTPNMSNSELIGIMSPKSSTQNRGEDSKVHGHDSNESLPDTPAIDEERGWFSGEGNAGTYD